MTPLRSLTRIVVVVFALALVFGPVAGSAAPGVEVTEVGWWSRNPIATAPDGGFQVANAPDGPASVAAVRLALEGKITKAILVINEDSGVPEAAAMRVCTTTATWSAANHTWANAPAATCGAAVQLTRNATGANWTGDITSLIPAGQASVSIMIVPEATAAARPAWQVNFSQAAVSAEAQAIPAPTTTTTTSSGSGQGSGSPPPTAGATFGGPSSGSGFPAFASGPSVTAPSSNFTNNPAPVDAPGTVADVSPATNDDASLGGIAAAPARATERQPWGRLFVFVPLSVAVSIALAVARRRLDQRPTA
ncbi:MAG: DUF7594 domain-containing protein [Acidimicrobiales bacterium]